ncbi:hypothetical protein D0Z00_001601 [Geotrichum galactomycetum]|uniref:Uncharacterized protein n=1 Tax=Geotrichum galactomycetum TaxID=27317 RepID=A0ACB6V6R5_9ASCO|nr:hypothetical protein D0Z00_001601 [Geotrichum candidum]
MRSAALGLASLDPNNGAAKRAGEWIAMRQRDTLLRKKHLTEELNQASAQVYTSSMAKCYEQLAELAFAAGEYSDAQSYISQQRDILMEADDSQIVLKLAMITYFAGRETSARAYTEKLAPTLVEKTGLFKETPFATRVGAMLGMLYFKHGHIRQAVALLLNLAPSQIEKISDITTSEDIATYIALGALATFSRAELSYLSKSDSMFILLTEQARQNFSDLIALLLNSKFTELFKQLNRYKTDYLLDPVLYSTLDDLLYRIHVRCLVQYLSVFSTVSLVEMAQAFDLSVEELEDQITQLIETRSVNVLIDQKRGMLVCRSQDDISNLVNSAEGAAQRYLAESKALLATLI